MDSGVFSLAEEIVLPADLEAKVKGITTYGIKKDGIFAAVATPTTHCMSGFASKTDIIIPNRIKYAELR